MHDIKAIRDNPDAFVAGWSSRGVEGADKVVADILSLDRELRAAQTRAQEALAPLPDSPARAALHDGVEHLLGTVAART